MEFNSDAISTNSVHEMLNLSGILGRVDYLSLLESIKDKNGNILIQSKRPLRGTMLSTLTEKFPNDEFTFMIEISKELKSGLANRVSNEITKKLSMADFSFAGFLLNRNPISIPRVLRGVFRNNFISVYLLSILYHKNTIFYHILEVALTGMGLLASVQDEEIEYRHFIALFEAAVLHDIAISDKKDWFSYESFGDPEQPGDHGAEGAGILSQKPVDSALAGIIEGHNRLQMRFTGEEYRTRVRWYRDFNDLLAVILNVSEYYYWFKTTMKATEEEAHDENNAVVYQLGLMTEKGAFPPVLMNNFKGFYAKYAKFFEYGQAVSKIENSCLFKDHALAYPKPRTTQVLCLSSTVDCPKRLHSQRMNLIQSKNSVINRFGVTLNSGWYDKCDLSFGLPKPPEDI